MLKLEIRSVRINDPLYPKLLKEINNPPKLLYYLGNFPPSGLYPLAVVGSRQADAYAYEALDHIFNNKILDQVVIISGLARGVDSLAHKIAKHTIAVLGSGLDKASFYPPENWELCLKIINSGGLVISEYPVGQKACAKNFPERNRLVAGLSKAVLIVQAKIKSGALITARLALENGREVLSVPGSILSELSQGPHKLIIDGAQPITNSQELLDYLNLS